MKKTVDKLTLTEKVGQMFIIGLDGTEITGDVIELIQTYKVGGIVLNKRNFENVEQMQNLINDLKAANAGNAVPLFIAMSQETGRSNQLPKDIRKLPAIKYIAENEDNNLIYETQSCMANILNKLGINMNFAPLLDMGGMVAGIPLGDRCVSYDDTNLVSNYGIQTINAYKNSGIISVPKYFPSHTSTKGDRSNITIPYSKKTLSKLEEMDLKPFRHVIEQGADAMLVGHIHLARFNMFAPSTMSHKIVTKLLKGRYKFNGVTICDDLCSTCMRVQYGIKDSARKAIKAGNDVMIIGDATKAEAVLEYIEKQITDRTLDEKEIDLSVQKILALKEKYNLNDLELENIDINKENNEIEKLLKKITKI